MYKKIFILLFLFSVVIILYSTHPVISNSNGAPPGYTGSPSDGQNCSVCHDHMDTSVTQVNWITTDIPVDGYNHTTIYNITVTIPGSRKKGFEASIQDQYGNLYGNIMAGTNSQLVGSGKYITQSSPGTQNPNTWTFQWMPPTSDWTANIYAAYTIDTNNTYLQSVPLTEQPCLQCHGSIYSFQDICSDFTSSCIEDGLMFSWNSVIDSKVNISLYTISGNLILCSNIMQHQGKNQFIIKTNGIKKGIYIVEVASQKTCSNFKVIIP